MPPHFHISTPPAPLPHLHDQVLLAHTECAQSRHLRGEREDEGEKSVVREEEESERSERGERREGVVREEEEAEKKSASPQRDVMCSACTTHTLPPSPLKP